MKTKLALFLAIFVTCIAVSQSFFAPVLPQKHLSTTRLHMADVPVDDPEKGEIVDYSDGLKVYRKLLIEEDDESMKCEYLVELDFPGKASKRIFNELEAEMSKTAQFKGFRKGKIPYFARKELIKFCFEQSISDGISGAMDFCKIDVAVNEKGNLVSETIEDREKLLESFEVGKDLQFSARVIGKEQKSAKVSKGDESAEVVDAEVV
uniref:Trigger factor ribosome-binding bacterial domain-containing protein n=1 Tax=Fibrocapsa japonica TaxID=94617 RepID=A0A7S2V5R4_9STRA